MPSSSSSPSSLPQQLAPATLSGNNLSIYPFKLLETKLLTKTVALAQLLSTRIVNLSAPTTNIRFRLLLVALLQVTRALNVTEKIIDGTDRYLELIHLLSHFSFPQCVQLLGDSRWVMAVHKKIMKSKLKRALGRWKTRTTVKGHGEGHRKDFGFLDEKYQSQKLDFFNERDLFTSDVILKPILKSEKKDPLRNALHKWQLAYRSKRVMECKNVELAQRILRIYHKFMILKRIYENYVGYGYRTETESMLSVASLQGSRALAKFVLCEWRGVAKLQRRQVRDHINGKRDYLEIWRNRTLQRVNRMKLAGLYDSTRSARPAFCTWLAHHTRIMYATDRARIHNTYLMKERVLSIWRDCRKKVLCKNQFLGRWRNATDYRRQQLFSSYQFYTRKILAINFQKWRHATKSNMTLERSAQKIIDRRSIESTLLFFTCWRQLSRWIDRSSEKVRTLRTFRDLRTWLNYWRKWREARSAADALYRAGLFRRTINVWQRYAISTRGKTDLKEAAFTTWRRTLSSRISTRTFARKKLLEYGGSDGGGVQVLNCAVSMEKLTKACLFSDWKKRAVLNRCIEMFEAKKNHLIKADLLKSWRMNANVFFYLRQKPWRSKKRIFRKMLKHFRTNSSNREGLNIKLSEYQEGRNYICYYRGFERWQQAFQSRKMEEHLCEQNLIYYHNRRRITFLCKWQLQTALKIFDRLKALKVRKEVIQIWKQTSILTSSSRTNRIISRFFTRWQQAYRESVARHYLLDKDRKTLRIVFISWRVQSRKQRDGHNRSIEFIGLSNLRYYLQKWRMEAAIRKYQESKKIDNRPRYTRRSTLTLSRDHFRNVPPHLPLRDTEFMV